MTPRNFAFSVLSMIYLAISGRNLLRYQAEWIQNLGSVTLLVVALVMVFSSWRQHRANRRASLRDKFSKMARHDNVR